MLREAVVEHARRRRPRAGGQRARRGRSRPGVRRPTSSPRPRSTSTERVGRLDTRRGRRPPPVAGARAGDDGPADRRDASRASTGCAATVGMQLVGEVFHGARWAAAFRAALETIAQIESIDERRLLLCRDARLLLAPPRRVDHRRRPRGGCATCATGGADGRLHRRLRLAREHRAAHARPRPARSTARDVLHDGGDGGYVHAPGLTHAATAGVLRSGRLTHRRGDPNNEALDIDLSSTRDARRALAARRHAARPVARRAARLPAGAPPARAVRRRARARPLHLRPAHARAAARRQAHRARPAGRRRASRPPTSSTACG